MKYLAVDLEACNMFVKGSVFSVGMVLADENFNIIFKRNYLINPLCRFAMNFRKPIDFKISKDDLKDKPTFAEIRDTLAEYLEDKDTVIMAHSANNDMYMFNEACKRAGVKPFNLRFICTQMIYSAVYNIENGIGLDKVSVQLGRANEFNHHQADDDSEMALYLLKHCMEKVGVSTFKEMEKKLGITKGSIKNAVLTSMRCNELDRLRAKRKADAITLQKRWLSEMQKSNAKVMHLDVRQFCLIKCGSKTIEVRLLDKKRKAIQSGDIVYFVRDSQHAQVLKTKVKLIEQFASFDEVFFAYDPASIGFRNGKLVDYLEYMYSIYDEKREHECGVCALHLEVLND